MQHMVAAGLRAIRESINVSREDVVRRAITVSASPISVSTIRNAERGLRVTRGTANVLLEAINALLADANKPSVTLDDLTLTL